MRCIAQFNSENHALKFWNFLKKQGIESSLEKAGSEEQELTEVWVEDEDRMALASSYLVEFQANPENSKFSEVPKKEIIKKPNISFNRQGYKEHNLGKKWHKVDLSPGVITLSIIITCVAVFLVSGMGKNTEIVGGLFISEKVNGQLSEIANGEVWRFFTPIFLHFNFLHILFNMFWLHDLGSQIERRKGPKFFITFLLLIALTSNLFQFVFSGPAFGGMSGVVYGLFGYVWIKNRLDPADGFRLDPTVAMIMFGFFLLCFTGMFGGVANWAHAGGLAVGLVWGYASAYRWNRGKN